MGIAVNPIVEGMRRRMRKTELLMEQLSDLQLDMIEVVEKLAQRIPPEVPGGGELWVQRVHGATDLEVWEDKNGQFSFSFDLQKRFCLQPRLAKALIFLATANGDDRSANGFVGFRSRPEFQAHLQKTAKPGKQILPRYVNNVSSLLRAAVKKHTGRDLIITNDEWGVRLLLKRGGLHGLESTTAYKWL
jgi:hypothetical protein